MQRFSLYLLLAFVLLSSGIPPLATPVSAQTPLPVVVSILPQQYMVEKIAGHTVSATVMVMPGASPATYEPRPTQLAELSRAVLYFSIGVPFEAAWLDRIASANANLILVAMDQGIDKLPISAHNMEDTSDDIANHTVEHAPLNGLDPHIWLAPAHMLVMARTTANALGRAAPEHKALYERNLVKFIDEIKKLDTDLHALFAALPHDKRAFMVFHPSWGYFAHAYGLQQVPIEVDGKEPGPRTMQILLNAAREHAISVVFAAPQFSQKTARVIARSINGSVVSVDPLAWDWAANLRRVADAFVASQGL